MKKFANEKTKRRAATNLAATTCWWWWSFWQTFSIPCLHLLITLTTTASLITCYQNQQPLVVNNQQQQHTSGIKSNGPVGIVHVPGNAALLRDAHRVDQIVYPYETYANTWNASGHEHRELVANVIDHKRFVEPYATRCFASTILEDPDLYEPSFVLITQRAETRLNATAPSEHIAAAGYEAQKRTTIFVHGFTQSYPETEWLRKVRALHEMHAHVGRHNLILMDWGLASHGSYAQVAARVSGMGSFLANFLMKLIIDLGTQRERIRIIGHSLGAHLAGFAGKRIRPKLGRITALDPAGPCFGKLFSNSPNDRLSIDDAHQVDVYHYDDSFLGLPGQFGHYDVYVNGGSSQPGAVDNINSMMQALVTLVFNRNRVLSESHTRSTEVATASLSPVDCQLVAYECRDYASFVRGECGECDARNAQCHLMSFPFQYDGHAARTAEFDALAEQVRTTPPTPHNSNGGGGGGGKRLFISTSADGHYCLQHYQVLVHFEPGPDLLTQAKRQKWRVHVQLMTTNGEHKITTAPTNITVAHLLEHQHQAGARITFTHLHALEQGPARQYDRALLQVRSATSGDTGPPVPLSNNGRHNMASSHGADKRPYAHAPRINSLEINFMSDINPSVRAQLSRRLCPIGWASQIARGTETSNHITTESGDEWLVLEPCAGHSIANQMRTTSYNAAQPPPPTSTKY